MVVASSLSESTEATTTPITVRTLGKRPYQEVLELQRSLQRSLIDSSGEDTLILCEHAPCITVGRSAKRANILANEKSLSEQGISVFEIERGGDVTFHGPGQLVAYPIVDLRRKKTDVGWYMRALEETIIRTLQEFGITGIRIPGKTGVWTQPLENGNKIHPRKVASIGIRLSRWCTLHGLSLNVMDQLEGFQFIHPCGFQDIEMTSMEREAREMKTQPPACSLEAVQESLTQHFCEVLKYERR